MILTKPFFMPRIHSFQTNKQTTSRKDAADKRCESGIEKYGGLTPNLAVGWWINELRPW